MPRYHFTVPHDLSKEEIRKRVEHFADNYGASTAWKGESECHFSGSYKGAPVSGVFKVFDDEVEVSVNLPLLAMPFKARIREEVVKALS